MGVSVLGNPNDVWDTVLDSREVSGSGRVFLPPCAICRHPYALHTIGVGSTLANCDACPFRCNYHYPLPLCRACGDVLESYVHVIDDGLYCHSCAMKETV